MVSRVSASAGFISLGFFPVHVILPLGVIGFPLGVVGFHEERDTGSLSRPWVVLFGAWLVPIQEVLAGRRLMVRLWAGWWISFIRGPRLGGGVP